MGGPAKSLCLIWKGREGQPHDMSLRGGGLPFPTVSSRAASLPAGRAGLCVPLARMGQKKVGLGGQKQAHCCPSSQTFRFPHKRPNGGGRRGLSGSRSFPPPTHEEHGQGLPHDGVEEVEGGAARHQEEVTEEEVLPAAVVQEGVVLAPEERLKGVLEGEDGGWLLGAECRHRPPQRACPPQVPRPPAPRPSPLEPRAHPDIALLGTVGDDDGPLQLSPPNDAPAVPQGEDGVAVPERWLGEEAWWESQGPSGDRGLPREGGKGHRPAFPTEHDAGGQVGAWPWAQPPLS